MNLVEGDSLVEEVDAVGNNKGNLDPEDIPRCSECRAPPGDAILQSELDIMALVVRKTGYLLEPLDEAEERRKLELLIFGEEGKDIK